MPNYRRSFIPGGTFFFTVITANRRPILTGPGRPLLSDAIRHCQEQNPFSIDAIVLLPDHLHSIWTLPEGDAEYSKRWGIIKKSFTHAWLAMNGPEQPVSPGQRHKRNRGVWQPRFWEHTIRDKEELTRYLDYIHYNPVKHGHARCPHTWEWSSFHRWVREGGYRQNWGCSCKPETRHKPMDFADIEKNVGE